jgi:hypothetical protein
MDEDPNAKEVSLAQLATAPFHLYVIEQNEGDMVITPSMAVYQMMSLVCAHV